MPESLNAAPPPDAVVLFAGANLDQWEARGGGLAPWTVDNGEMTTRNSDIVSRQRFEDFYLHVEFRCPNLPPEVTGQGRSNSGVFLQGRYEIQVLDSYGIAEPGQGDCGALYNHAAPLVNACTPPEEWETYDAFFRAPRFDATGAKIEDARVTLLLNGVLIQNNVALSGQTGGALDENYHEAGPIMLQFHGDAVRYRNVWVQSLPLSGANHY